MNTDTLQGNQISGDGSPAISDFLLKSSKDVPQFDHPGKSLYDKWMEEFRVKVDERKSAPPQSPGTAAPLHPVNILGSGSDYTPFYQHLGVLSANLGLNSSTYGTYHSTMDSVPYMDKFGNPGYTGLVEMSRWWGLMALRLADATVLPFDYRTYGKSLHQYLTEFESQTKSLGYTVDFTKVRQSADAFLLAADVFHE